VAVVRVLLIAAFIACWELAVELKIVDGFFVPAPHEILRAATTMWGEQPVQTAVRETAVAIAVAFALGTAAGIVGGYLIGTVNVVRRAFLGPLLFVLSTPKAIFIPVFLLFFGISLKAAALFAAFEAFFYVSINVISGVDLVRESHRRVGQAFGASAWDQIVHILLPASLPGIFTGIWYGIKHAFLGVMVLELYASAEGIGSLIRTYTTLLENAKVFALIIVISIGSILIGGAWNYLERWATPWRVQA
jgi:ABC-type nitrate/sulfonate/bicarbonate transport system permease component